MFLRFSFFYMGVVYSASFAFLSFYCHSRFRFHPLLPVLLFRHCFLPRISYVCLFLFSFWAEVFFCGFRHNRSCDKLQVYFLKCLLSSNNIFLLLVFWLSNISFITFVLFFIFIFFSFVVRILDDHALIVVLTYLCT